MMSARTLSCMYELKCTIQCLKMMMQPVIVSVNSCVGKFVLPLQCVADKCSVYEDGPWRMVKGQDGKDGWQCVPPKKDDPKIKAKIAELSSNHYRKNKAKIAEHS